MTDLFHYQKSSSVIVCLYKSDAYHEFQKLNELKLHDGIKLIIFCNSFYLDNSSQIHFWLYSQIIIYDNNRICIWVSTVSAVHLIRHMLDMHRKFSFERDVQFVGCWVVRRFALLLDRLGNWSNLNPILCIKLSGDTFMDNSFIYRQLILLLYHSKVRLGVRAVIDGVLKKVATWEISRFTSNLSLIICAVCILVHYSIWNY